MGDKICIKCGYEGRGKTTPRGSKMVEVLIYSTVVIPGPFYSIWRRMNLPEQCPNCKYPQMVKLNTAEGQIAQKKFDIEMGIIKPQRTEEDLPTSTKPENEQTPLSFGATQSVKAEEKLTRAPIDPEAW